MIARRARLRAALGTTALLGALLAGAIGGPATAQTASADDGVDISVTIPGTGVETVDRGQLRWGMNVETGSGAFFGGCNFLSAGAPGNAGASRLWTKADGLYRATDGNVAIYKPTAAGGWAAPTWETKCQDATGRTVTSSASDKGTGAQVAFDGGTGSVDLAKGTAQLSWKGSFAVVYYGGLSYWWVSDPRLSVANGKGTLSAAASGYGADMNDVSKWIGLAPANVVLASLSNVVLGEKGITVTPDYRGVKVKTPSGGTAQDTSAKDWGSFPQSFIDFQAKTGQSSYWYSSGGARDYAKPATTIYISYDSTKPVSVATPPTTAPGSDLFLGAQHGGTVFNPSGGGSGSGAGAASGSAPPGGAQSSAASLTQKPAAAAVSAVKWLGNQLIPQPLAKALARYRDAFLWVLAGVLVLGAGASIGFRRGWLMLPRRK